MWFSWGVLLNSGIGEGKHGVLWDVSSDVTKGGMGVRIPTFLKYDPRDLFKNVRKLFLEGHFPAWEFLQIWEAIELKNRHLKSRTWSP